MRHFARGFNGDDIFWVELHDFGMERLFFETSLKIDLHEFPRANEIIRIITNKEISEQARDMFVQRLFNEIFKIPGIQKYYFKKEELDKSGRYIGESWEK